MTISAVSVSADQVQPEPLISTELVPHSLRERAESRVRDEGERGVGATRNLVLASTAVKVLRLVDVPVLVIAPTAP